MMILKQTVPVVTWVVTESWIHFPWTFICIDNSLVNFPDWQSSGVNHGTRSQKTGYWTDHIYSPGLSFFICKLGGIVPKDCIDPNPMVKSLKKPR